MRVRRAKWSKRKTRRWKGGGVTSRKVQISARDRTSVLRLVSFKKQPSAARGSTTGTHRDDRGRVNVQSFQDATQTRTRFLLGTCAPEPFVVDTVQLSPGQPRENAPRFKFLVWDLPRA
jgi:hypothetical protein